MPASSNSVLSMDALMHSGSSRQAPSYLAFYRYTNINGLSLVHEKDYPYTSGSSQDDRWCVLSVRERRIKNFYRNNSVRFSTFSGK